MTFARWYVEAWMKHGVFPPPMVGSPYRADSVTFAMCFRDARDAAGPQLTVDDERGVEIQQRACEKLLEAARLKHRGEDPIIACNCPR